MYKFLTKHGTALAFGLGVLISAIGIMTILGGLGDYNMLADVFSGYVQAQFKYNKVDFYASANVTSTQYQSEGLFQNESFENNSFGKGNALSFTGIGIKAGATYKITGKHVIDVNAGYITKAPSIRNSFSNSRSRRNRFDL